MTPTDDHRTGLPPGHRIARPRRFLAATLGSVTPAMGPTEVDPAQTADDHGDQDDLERASSRPRRRGGRRGRPEDPGDGPGRAA
jgi:hypothetical protein